MCNHCQEKMFTFSAVVAGETLENMMSGFYNDLLTISNNNKIPTIIYNDIAVVGAHKVNVKNHSK